MVEVESRRPLTGVVVVELANYISGPFAAMMLADLGAEVAKVEPLSGDPFRRFGRPSGPASAQFVNVNRGKSTRRLDLKDPAGTAAVRALLAEADVVVSNWRPGVADRLGLADDDLAQLNPHLIRAYITGVGRTGPDASSPVFDTVIQAQSALASLQGSSEQPHLVVGYIIDKLTAIMCVQAVLAALYEREHCGVGIAIDVPMLDVAAYFNFPDLFSERTFIGADVDGACDRATQLYANRPLRARDGRYVLPAVSREQLTNALQAVGAPTAVLETLTSRGAADAIDQFYSAVEDRTRAHTLAWCAERFAERDVPFSPCLTPDEHLADPQVFHNDIYRVAHDVELGWFRHVRYPARARRWGTLGLVGDVDLV